MDSEIHIKREKRYCRILGQEVTAASEWEVYFDPLVEGEREKLVRASYCENRVFCSSRNIRCIHTMGTAADAPDPLR